MLKKLACKGFLLQIIVRNSRQINLVSKPFSTEAELIDLFEPKDKPHYDRIFTADPTKKEPRVQSRNTDPKKRTVLINCKRKELNHHLNQKYDKFKPITLACKGWNHSKSKGDFFTIMLKDDNSNSESLYWDDKRTFSDLNLNSDVVEILKTQGIVNPTNIQVQSVSNLLSGRNCLIAAETGCGKTLAYLLPIIEQLLVWSKLKSDRPNSPLALVISPFRELALQIGSVAKTISHGLPIRSKVFIGGRTKRKMLNPEIDPVDLLVATPGALSKLISNGLYNVDEVRHVVVDEADSMLDDSFSELLLRILKKIKINYQNPALRENYIPDGAQLTLVSATMPKAVYNILEGIVETDSLLTIKSKRLHRVLPHVPQTFYRVGISDKPTKLLQLAKQSVKNNQPTIVFSNKSSTCDWISLMLNENGVPTINLNGGMHYMIRQGKYNEFKFGNVMVLSCTDIASRGLDTTHVKHILNYDFPTYMADYIHRCGRTGRCGSSPDSFVSSFISRSREVDLLQKIEMAVRVQEDLPNVDGNITKLINKT